MNRPRKRVYGAIAVVLLLVVVIAGLIVYEHYWWVPPAPAPVSVTIAGGCPEVIGSLVGVRNSGFTFYLQMAPPLPTTGLICRYGATQSAVGHQLYLSKTLTQPQAGRLVYLMNRAGTARPHGTAECPPATNAASVIVLGYAHRPNVDLWYAEGGCKSLDNGRLGADELGNPGFSNGFEAYLNEVAPPPPTAP